VQQPRQPPARLVRDEALTDDVIRVHPANYGVYAARKVWLALNRQGIVVAGCTVERLMRQLGLVGARRGKKVRATVPDPAAARPADRRVPEGPLPPLFVPMFFSTPKQPRGKRQSGRRPRSCGGKPEGPELGL
jgi:transposase InsO family protein